MHVNRGARIQYSVVQWYFSIITCRKADKSSQALLLLCYSLIRLFFISLSCRNAFSQVIVVESSFNKISRRPCVRIIVVSINIIFSQQKNKQQELKKIILYYWKKIKKSLNINTPLYRYNNLRPGIIFIPHRRFN